MDAAIATARSAGRAALAALLLGALPAAARAPLTAQELAGRRIYHRGESPSGAGISAMVGGDAVLPGAAVPCAGCHGGDGLGRAEGGTRPSVIVWSHLTKRYGHAHEDGRRHPAFTPETLARAIRTGEDPAGNALAPAMPRYSLAPDDMASLVAYLRRLEHDLDPGVAADAVRVGTVLPSSGRLAATAAAVRGILEGTFAELNAAGGLHGRRLELAVASYDPAREDGREALSRLLAGGEVFALVATVTPGAERAVAALAGEAGVPVVGPLTSFTEEDDPTAHVFYVSAGVREQARVLARYAAETLAPGAGVGIVHGRGGPLAGAAQAARAELATRGAAPAVLERTSDADDAGIAARLRAGGVATVLFLGADAELAAFARAAEAAGFAPRLLVPGSLSARAAVALPRAFEGKVHLAYPSLPSDETEAGAARLAAARKRARLDDAHRGAQVSAYVAAEVLAEGLRRTGRHLTRDGLVARLDGLYRHPSGLAPPVTFGPGRRVGSLGAYVVAADLAERGFRPVTGWIALD